MAAVGSVVVTTSAVRSRDSHYQRVSVAWLCSAAGAVSGNPFSAPAGVIESVRFKPGAATPTDGYDVTVVDTDSVDVLFGAGANALAASATVVRLSPGYFHDGSRTLDVVVANAGNAKTGTVELLIRS